MPEGRGRRVGSRPTFATIRPHRRPDARALRAQGILCAARGLVLNIVRKCEVAGLFGALIAIAGAGLAAAGTSDREQDCFHQLENGRGAEIVCAFPTRLSEQEQADLRRITRDVLQDAHCVVSIRFPRRLLDDALAAADHVFEAQIGRAHV